jgi:hypothetical protein
MFQVASPKRELDGRLFYCFYFIEFRFTEHIMASPPQGEGEQMDYGPPRRKRNPRRPTLGNVHIFSTSSQVLTVGQQDNEEEYSSVDDEGLSSEDKKTTLKMTLMTLKTERMRNILLQKGGTPVVPIIAQ